MSPDAERVLGQIERGEIWCGPDAARTIAARHEEAYGHAWHPANEPTTTASEAQAQALVTPTNPSSNGAS